MARLREMSREVLDSPRRNGRAPSWAAAVAILVACAACGDVSRPPSSLIEECVEQQFDGMTYSQELNHYTRTIEGETWHYFDLEIRVKDPGPAREFAKLSKELLGEELEMSQADFENAMAREVSLRTVKRGKRWYFEWLQD